MRDSEYESGYSKCVAPPFFVADKSGYEAEKGVDDENFINDFDRMDSHNGGIYNQKAEKHRVDYNEHPSDDDYLACAFLVLSGIADYQSREGSDDEEAVANYNHADPGALCQDIGLIRFDNRQLLLFLLPAFRFPFFSHRHPFPENMRNAKSGKIYHISLKSVACTIFKAEHGIALWQVFHEKHIGFIYRLAHI